MQQKFCERAPFKRLPSGLVYVECGFDPLYPPAMGLSGLPHSVRNAVPKRRAEFLAGRSCAERAIRQLTGETVPIPMLPDRRPHWPPHITGSITHNSGRAAVLAGLTDTVAMIGLDCEAVMQHHQAMKLRQLVLSDREFDLWTRLLSPAKAVTAAFSIKETIYKAVSQKIGPYPSNFKDVEIIDITDNGAKLTWLTPPRKGMPDMNVQFTLYCDFIYSYLVVFYPAAEWL